jgi:uncharacterized membrane protein
MTAVVFAVAALLLARKAPWPPLVVLLAFGWQHETAHASPHGPIAFALLIVAAIWLWWAERRNRENHGRQHRHCRLDRQFYAGAQPATRAVGQREFAAMRLHD